MPNEIVPFLFRHDQDETPIRTLMIDGDLWFVAVDVCRALGLDNTTEALRGLDADEKDTFRIVEGISGNPMHSIISEPGLYNLFRGSRKPAAKQFRRFVDHEILPSIRKTGRYVDTGASPEAEVLDAVQRVAFEVHGMKAAQIGMKIDIADIKVKLNGGRENFPRPAVRYVAEGMAKHENGECLYCHDTTVVNPKTGERIEGASQEHHADGNRANTRADNCALPCYLCHPRLTNPNRPDHIPPHIAQGINTAFQRKVKQRAGQIRPPTSTAAKHWDFRGATQADMGWPTMWKAR